jgi:hypothetical protein
MAAGKRDACMGGPPQQACCRRGFRPWPWVQPGLRSSRPSGRVLPAGETRCRATHIITRCFRHARPPRCKPRCSCRRHFPCGMSSAAVAGVAHRDWLTRTRCMARPPLVLHSRCRRPRAAWGVTALQASPAAASPVGAASAAPGNRQGMRHVVHAATAPPPAHSPGLPDATHASPPPKSSSCCS